MKKTNLFTNLNKAVYALFMMAAVSLTFTACDSTDPEPEPEPENSILEIVEASSTHTQLEEFVKADDELISILGGQNLTLFAPDDAAFDKLKERLGVSSLLQVDPEIIKKVLEFHIANTVVRRADITAESEILTEQGENITINPGTGNIATGGTDSDVQFIGDEIVATNGVVHVVETILIPPSIFSFIVDNLGYTSQTIFLGADFTVLADAIQIADGYATENNLPTLTSVLADPAGSVTVFAPINAVFAGAGITLETFTAEQWYGIIATHVVIGDFSAEELGTALANGTNTYATAAQTNIQITPGVFTNPTTGEESQTLFAGGAPVVSPDITSNNGRVHAVAGVVSSLNKYTTVLLGSQGNDAEGFYNAFSNVKYSYAEARDASTVSASPVDFAYYFGNTNKATLASIDDAGLNAVYTTAGLPIEGIFGTRNSTKFRVTSLAPAQFDGILLNSQLEAAASSENNTNSSATDLQAGSVVAFTLDSDRGSYVGLIKVVSLDDTNGTGTMTIEVKVQVAGN